MRRYGGPRGGGGRDTGHCASTPPPGPRRRSAAGSAAHRSAWSFPLTDPRVGPRGAGRARKHVITSRQCSHSDRSQPLRAESAALAATGSVSSSSANGLRLPLIGRLNKGATRRRWSCRWRPSGVAGYARAPPAVRSSRGFIPAAGHYRRGVHTPPPSVARRRGMVVSARTVGVPRPCAVIVWRVRRARGRRGRRRLAG